MTDVASEWRLPRDVAIPRLLEQHGGQLYALGQKICGSPDEAEDLVQEVFMQAWRKWAQFDGRSRPVVWLYTIAHRLCQRMHRHRAGEPARMESLDVLVPLGEPSMGVPAADGTGVGGQIRCEQVESIGTAIAALPDDFRMALVLKDIIGFSLAEAGEILGVNPATVKTRVHRARLRLRAALDRGLPQRELPPPAYSKQVCLDLLQAKQDSLDRGVEMPNADAIICERCNAVFATLDLTRDICSSLAAGSVPDRLRDVLAAEMRRSRSR